MQWLESVVFLTSVSSRSCLIGFYCFAPTGFILHTADESNSLRNKDQITTPGSTNSFRLNPSYRGRAVGTYRVPSRMSAVGPSLQTNYSNIMLTVVGNNFARQ